MLNKSKRQHIFEFNNSLRQDCKLIPAVDKAIDNNVRTVFWFGTFIKVGSIDIENHIKEGIAGFINECVYEFL